MYIDFKRMDGVAKAEFLQALEDCGFSPVTPDPIQRIDFSEQIPLDGAYVMTPEQLFAPTTFWPKGKRILGGYCYLRLIVTLGPTPTFVGMTEDSSSKGWDNTAGTINLVTIWYDGAQILYKVSQATQTLSPAGITQAVIDGNQLDHVIVSFSNPLSPFPVPNFSDFTALVGGVDGTPNDIINIDINGTDVTLTLASAVGPSDLICVSYVPADNAPLTDAEGYSVDAFANIPATPT